LRQPPGARRRRTRTRESAATESVVFPKSIGDFACFAAWCRANEFATAGIRSQGVWTGSYEEQLRAAAVLGLGSAENCVARTSRPRCRLVQDSIGYRFNAEHELSCLSRGA
jgi:hypothetical protein